MPESKDPNVHASNESAHDELTLDKETITDLNVRDTAADIRGGYATRPNPVPTFTCQTSGISCGCVVEQRKPGGTV